MTCPLDHQTSPELFALQCSILSCRILQTLEGPNWSTGSPFRWPVHSSNHVTFSVLWMTRMTLFWIIIMASTPRSKVNPPKIQQGWAHPKVWDEEKHENVGITCCWKDLWRFHSCLWKDIARAGDVQIFIATYRCHDTGGTILDWVDVMNSQFERSGKAQAQREREFQAKIRHYLRRCVLLQIRHYQRHTLDILRRVDWSGFPIWLKKWQGQLLEAAGYTANALVCDVAMSCVVEIDKQPFSFPFLFMSSGSSPMIFACWSFRKQPVPEVLHEALGRRAAPQLAASSLSQAAKSCCQLPVFWNQELTFQRRTSFPKLVQTCSSAMVSF